MAQIIWLDEAGNEIRRQNKGRGRPPKGSEIRNGDFYVSANTADTTIYCILVDVQGKEIKRWPKGRGRAAPGFVKNNDSHWYKTESSPVIDK